MISLDKKITKHALAAEEVWGKAYDKFPRVISKKKLKKGVELGVAFGGHTEAILKNTAVEHLYGVDPYLHIAGYDDPMNLPQNEFDAIFKFVKKRMASFGKRYIHIRQTSERAASSIKEALDFIYIDANHSYKGVWGDLIRWYPKILEGGIIGGHDYGHPSFPGVKRAVDKFFGRLSWPIHEEGEGVWWVEKKPVSVSFIMPTYNAEKTIEASAESIFKDNFLPGDEVVIVNDCSTDNTAGALKNLQKKHPEIKIFNHAINKGGGAARNTAVKHAKNALIFCLDADNVLAPDSVIKLRDFLVVSGGDAASFSTLKYFKIAPSNVTHQWHFDDNNASLEGALSTYKFPGSSGNYLFTKESWQKAGRYPEFAGALDAWGFGLRQVATGSKMTVMPQSFYYHRYGHDSYWMREARTGETSARALQLLTPFLNQLNERDVDHIKSERARNNWFDNLEKRPVRVRKRGGRSPLLIRIKKRLKK